MLMLLLSLVLSAHAKTDNCSLTEILKAAKPDQKCVENYLAKIPNEEDRGEAKFRLQEWKPIKDLEVRAEGGAIEAYSGGKVIMRSIILKMQKPMIIWMDGKILVDNSDNPSFARRLANAMKTPKSAFLDLVVPDAYAEDPQVGRAILMYYTVSGDGWGGASVAVHDADFNRFLPPNNWLTRLMPAREIKCAAKDLVGPAEFMADDTYGVNTRLMVTPQSTTEFLIKGLKRGVTHRVRLNSEVSDYRGNLYRALDARKAGQGMVIETCADEACAQVTKTEKLEDWNLILRLSPEQEAAKAPKRLKTNAQTFREMNDEFRQKLANRLFGLSVMGDCCSSDRCRDEMLERHNIKLQPNGSSPTTAQ
jgi:hypothetical protein